MKKRNLFLSLISSVLVAVAIVTVTIVSVVKPKTKKVNPASNVDVVSDSEKTYDYMNENERDGSAELPYIIYSTDSFNDLLSAYGEAGVYHFEIVNDIDFAGIDYKTICKAGFKGHINGNGYKVSNITINVTKNNLIEFKYGNSAHIGIFGRLNGAKIENVTFNAVNINVDSNVYDSVQSYTEFSVGTIAGIAEGATIEDVKVNSNIDAFAYSSSANNSMGGAFGSANDLVMRNSEIRSNIKANTGSLYLIGGVAGYGRTATVSKVNVEVNIESAGSRKLRVGGLFAYARLLTATDITIDLGMTDNGQRATYVNGLLAQNSINGDDLSLVAGIVAQIRANDENQKSTISNVTVNANVDFDCIYAGAFLDILSSKDMSEALRTYVSITDVVVSSDVNALAAHAFARQVKFATISFSDTGVKPEGYCNLRLTGNVKLSSYKVSGQTFSAATLISATSKSYYNADYKSFYIELSAAIASKLPVINTLSINQGAFGSYKAV